MRLAIRNSRPDRAEDRLLVAGGRRGAANADDEDLGWFQRAARSVCFFAPPTFVAFHRRTPVLVERRRLPPTPRTRPLEMPASPARRRATCGRAGSRRNKS